MCSRNDWDWTLVTYQQKMENPLNQCEILKQPLLTPDMTMSGFQPYSSILVLSSRIIFYSHHSNRLKKNFKAALRMNEDFQTIHAQACIVKAPSSLYIIFIMWHWEEQWNHTPCEQYCNNANIEDIYPHLSACYQHIKVVQTLSALGKK